MLIGEIYKNVGQTLDAVRLGAFSDPLSAIEHRA
jgi:hypothetical protein